MRKFAAKLFKQDVMKKNFNALYVMLAVCLTLTSCLGDSDEDTTVYSDTAITAMTLGTLNKYTETVSSNTGNDTIIKSTMTGSVFGMTINQLDNTIYNHDLLPSGTDLKHVIISSISTKNNGIVTIRKSTTSDSIAFYNSADSIDMSYPRIFRVYSSDLEHFREYTVELKIDSTTNLSFEWKRVDTRADLAGWTDKHLVAFGDSVRLVDTQVVSNDSCAFWLDGTDIKRSEDMANWSVMGSDNLKQLLGMGTMELIALGSDGKVKRSGDNGATWQEEALDDDASLLPVSDVAMTAFDYAPIDSTDFLIMAGTDASGQMQIWRKISQYGGPTKGGKWVYMPVDQTNTFVLPQLKQLSMTYYHQKIMVLGSDKVIYESRDQGITWRASTTYAIPASLTGSVVTIAADSRNRLWMVTDTGELWMGKE